MSGVIGSRDGRLFVIDATYDYDSSGQPLEKGAGWIDHWRELRPDELRVTAEGYPNTEAQAAIIARMIFEREHVK